jgi:hypothetical protein
VCAVIANTAQCVHVLVDVLIHIDEVQHRLLVHHPTNITALHWCHADIHAENDDKETKKEQKKDGLKQKKDTTQCWNGTITFNEYKMDQSESSTCHSLLNQGIQGDLSQRIHLCVAI